MKYTATFNGEIVDVEFTRKNSRTIEAKIGDRQYVLEAKAVEPGIYWIAWNNQSLEVCVVDQEDGYVVVLNGKRLQLGFVDSRSALRRAAKHSHKGIAEIRAPMPGKVVKVLATQGSEVQANEGILVIEAMKMQNEIKSPKPGVVKQLNVVEGNAVNSGDLLATVD